MFTTSYFTIKLHDNAKGISSSNCVKAGHQFLVCQPYTVDSRYLEFHGTW